MQRTSGVQADAGAARRSRRWRRAALAAAITALVVLLALLALLAMGELLTRPAARLVGPPPADLGASSVRLRTAQGAAVVGWFVPGASGAGAVLLLHGVRADRRQMLDRARSLRGLAYSVLLIDLPAHGESEGERIGFGGHESVAVAVALAWLRRELPGERIGVIAVSLGAAALVLAEPEPPPSAVVLESMYPTIAEAAGNRLALRLGPIGHWLAPLLLWQLPLRLGLSAAQLRPIDAIARLRAPLLIAAGTLDRHTRWPETERLFVVAAPPKELWAVAGAAHEDLRAFDPAAYDARVLGFLARHLRGGAAR